MMFKFIFCFVGFAVTILTVNANEEVANSHPRYHVSIMKINEDESLEHLCDGAILNTRHVITAAHCVFDADLKHLRIQSGSEVAPPAGMPHRDERLFHRIVKVMLPADYVNLPCRAHEHDIAIVKVGRAFDLSYDKLYKQINLPEPSNDYEGYDTLLTGHIDGKLESFAAKVISNEFCAKNSTSIITRANVCAFINDDFKTEGAISGSPLVYDNTLVGVMNAPSKCAISSDVKSSFKCVGQAANMKIYTRITTYLEFVNKVTNNLLSADIIYRT